ncbi:MAG: hypothetical protein EB168_08725 [Euryarchaeota archaeon]|nr:hypothetical protein [Euryarchaeota archaeon]
MFRLKTLTVKNFMSVGNATQAVNFDRRDLTLVLGVNIDLGGDDSGARNGTGKTTIINALSYALFGQALTNIRRDNLINKTNTKGMLVSLDFEHNGQNYKIERGRKKNVMRFFVGDQEQDITDMAQGDSRETQKAIEGMLGMSHEMFKHLVALNTYTQPFLTLRANDQKDIIEQLLGITMLSEKADSLKERLKATKDGIKEEEYRIQAQQEANEKISDQIDSLKRRQTLWASKQSNDISSLETALDDLGKLDIEAELELHKDLKTWQELTAQVDQVDTAIQQAERDYRREETAMQKLQADIDLLQEHKCHACEAKDELGDPGARPETYYEHAEDAYEHKNSLSQLQSQLQQRKTETDPYKEQIEEMEKTAGTEIDYEAMNALTRLRDHQEFLQKLLTNKDSFIRKRIIDQNLSYLNSRLSYYLDKIGLPHTVTFLSDLSVEIQELGRELDFDNLSRGERNRLILSLSWAFRDVYESLYDPINLLFIDELIDSGMDASGVESALALLKKMSREHKKSIWLVSHKDELAGRVNNIMTVTKENGFTTYGNDVDTV